MVRKRLVRMELEGVRELTGALDQFTNQVAKNINSRALIDAAEPMVQGARANAPRDSGELQDSIIASSKFRKRVRRRKDEALAYVGPSYSKSDPNYAPYAHLVEFGTAARFHKNGKYVGQVAPNPFLRPAFDTYKQSVVVRFGRSLRTEIDKAAARAARKAVRLKSKGLT